MQQWPGNQSSPDAGTIMAVIMISLLLLKPLNLCSQARSFSSKIGPLPDYTQPSAQRMEALPSVAPQGPLDQLTVNEYAPGVGLAAHVDTHSAFTGRVQQQALVSNHGCLQEVRSCQPSLENLCLSLCADKTGCLDRPGSGTPEPLRHTQTVSANPLSAGILSV